MSGWHRDEVWLGLPMKVLRISARELRTREWDMSLFFDPHHERFTYAVEALKGVLAFHEVIPVDSDLIGVQRPTTQDAIEFTFMHPSFPRTPESDLFPIVDVRLPMSDAMQEAK